jgi:quinol monooxygenase YgiN
MSDQAVTVVARVKAKGEKLDAVKEMLLGLVGPTRQEPGCITYVLHQSTDDPCSFVFLETWRGQGDLDEHLQKPYLQAFIGQADAVLAEPLDVTLWHALEP